MSDRHHDDETADWLGAHTDTRENRERLRLLIGSVAQATWETDPDGQVMADSPSWRAYTGQTYQEWLGYGWLDAIHPDDRGYAERQWREAVAARSLVDAEFRLRSPEGGWRWTNVRAAPLLDERGDVRKWVGMNINIDDRKRAELALRESEERYRAIFASIDEGFAEIDLIVDGDGRVVDWRYLTLNPAFTRMTGMADVSGLLISEILPDLEPEWGEHYTRLLQSGEPVRFEQFAESIDMWLDVYAVLVGGRGSRRAMLVYNDITSRKRAEAALRQSEERQAFLLRLSDALRPLNDPIEVQRAAMRILCEDLGVARASFYEIGEDQEHFRISQSHSTVAGPAPTPYLRFSSLGFLLSAYQAGETLVFDDTATDPRFDAAIRTDIVEGRNAAATIAVPLVKGGRLIAKLAVHRIEPHRWSAHEIAMVQETAERTWAAAERARAEAMLRESEERFQQFGRASSDGLWVRDAATLALEYASDAMETIYGISREKMTAEVMAWPAVIVPEDRQETFDYIDRMKAGESVVHEFRIQRPSDLAFRWIRSVGFPLFGMDHGVARIAGISSDITEERLLAEHQSVLLAELQHRVRNIMAIIRSIVARTADRADDLGDYVGLLSGRLLTLARVQGLLTHAPDAKVPLAVIVQEELAAQATHAGQFDIEGPDVSLSPKAAETMTLAVHELTTNALKYGALATSQGKVTVRWRLTRHRDAPWLAFDWSESGAPVPERPAGSRRTGFGSELIEGRVPYELGGRGSLTIGTGGAHCTIDLPLEDGHSILETDAPKRATLFGGAIDMSGQADLTGTRVLVVEDDYYLASDTARALRGAGAEVIGPCPTETAARRELAGMSATCAVLDINLNGGRSFDLARELKRDAVPFVFVTGYDQDVIPDDLADVRRLQKPVEFRTVVGTLAAMLEERN